MSERPDTVDIVVVNGDYARELVETAEVLVGALDVHVIETTCHQGTRELRQRVRSRLIRLVEEAPSVLLLSDLCGSTPTNVCLDLLGEHRDWELLTGLNLPMLLKLATCDRGVGARELALQLRATASASIKLGTPLLTEETSRGD